LAAQRLRQPPVIPPRKRHQFVVPVEEIRDRPLGAGDAAATGA